MERTPFGPKPWLASLSIVGIILGSLVLVGCGMQKARMVVMLDESVRRYGAEMPSVQWTNL